ncbi:hypothetical protein [Actinomadura rudentiformis]|uniref:hypothetical protein n=1 Tax=Actinomadura rudentiformis TaxID=359158 RepID=UPI001CEF8511|nr:hypothetical protein [Actinomadura rudentiformis]
MSVVPFPGGASPVAEVTPEYFAAVMERWDTAAAATWNRHLPALALFATWAQRQEVLETNPAQRMERRKTARRGDHAIPRGRLDKLFTGDEHGLRERVLWRMLYGTAAGTEGDEVQLAARQRCDPPQHTRHRRRRPAIAGRGLEDRARGPGRGFP